jgi:hypothetical protein
MKICWDTLERLAFSQNGYFYIKTHTYYEFDRCATCGDPYLDARKNSKYCTIKCAKNDEDYKRNLSKENSGKKNPMYGRRHPSYRGGKDSPAKYDLYVHRIEPIEHCRRNDTNTELLEVKCTYCGRWFIPNPYQVHRRIIGINTNGINAFYCSNGCKKECPMFRKVEFYKGRSGYGSREVQPQLRQLVFARDQYTCQKCGSLVSLHCHHIEPVSSNPIESADVDNAITLCKVCHKGVHTLLGCGYLELNRCNSWTK